MKKYASHIKIYDKSNSVIEVIVTGYNNIILCFIGTFLTKLYLKLFTRYKIKITKYEVQ